ncbi:hypothetical protein [Leucobacter aridicollis]|uniref:hypothetical protein n=1 Tax=Leucobacter aridicollis TaxID=283878 RepID=UPI002107E4C8|nr:hypothetical protein [Leucobacter aridicollis]UTX53568.1 hypothetical protein KI794_02115 [Leucobacter aridicollis]
MSNTQDFNPSDAQNADAKASAESAPNQEVGQVRLIRYWLRAVDTLVTREVDARFAEAGASRRDLRMLSLISSGSKLSDKQRARLDRRSPRLWALADRGWITRDRRAEGAVSPTGWILTGAGEAARERLQQIAKDVQDRIESSVSDEDLSITTDSLEAIANELGWTEELRARRRGGRRAWDPRRGHGHGYGHGHGHGRGYGHDQDHCRDHGRGKGGERSFHMERGFGPGAGANSGRGRDWHDGRGYGRGHAHGHGRVRGFERGFTAGVMAARSRD